METGTFPQIVSVLTNQHFPMKNSVKKLSTSSNSNQINSGMNASRKFLLNTSCLSKGKLLLPEMIFPEVKRL